MNQITERRYYIDWVRVLAFFLLIFFHCAMPFVTYNWEIKNKDTSPGLSRLVWWLHQWRLPLLFFISGVGIHFSLKKRSVLLFARERFVRLFIPLVFAMLFTIPLQVYFEKLQRGKISGSYAGFYPGVWNFIPYPEGTLSWSHMWFVVYLFVLPSCCCQCLQFLK
jgi:glucans biosynthesis protein C